MNLLTLGVYCRHLVERAPVSDGFSKLTATGASWLARSDFFLLTRFNDYKGESTLCVLLYVRLLPSFKICNEV